MAGTAPPIWWPAIAGSLLGVSALPALAQDPASGPEGAGGPDAVEIDAVAELPGDSGGSELSAASGLSPAAAVSLAKPVGSLRIAQVGDDLGRVRRGRKSSSNGIVTLDFSPSSASSRYRFDGVALPAGMPLDRARLTSQFGYRYHPVTGRYRRHAGIDLAAPSGTPIHATSDGMVMAAGWMGGYGIAVRLDHGAGTETRYAHMSRAAVSPGDTVRKGQVIGYVGSTGRSTGPHLHYEIRKHGTAVNPMP